MANRTLYLKDEVVAKLDHLAKEGGARSRSEWLTKTIEDIHAQVGHIYADYTHSIRIKHLIITHTHPGPRAVFSLLLLIHFFLVIRRKRIRETYLPRRHPRERRSRTMTGPSP